MKYTEKARFINNTFGILFSQILNVLSGVFLLRVIGVKDYGLFSWILGGYLVFAGLCGNPISLAASRYTSLRDCNYGGVERSLVKIAWLLSFVTGGFAVLACCGVAWFPVAFAGFLPENWSLVALLLFLPVMIYLECHKCIVVGSLLGRGEIVYLNLIRIVDTVPLYLAAAVFGWVWGHVGLMASLPFAVAVRYVFARALSISVDSDREGVEVSFSELFRFVLLAMLSGMFVTPALWLGLTGLFRVSGAESVALFNVANQWRTAAQMPSNSYNAVILPIMANAFSIGDWRSMIIGYMLKSLGLGVVSSLALLLCVPWIMLAYGIDAEKGLPIFFWLSVANVAQSIASVIGTTCLAAGRSVLNVVLNVSWFGWFWIAFVLVDVKSARDLAVAVSFATFLCPVTAVVIMAFDANVRVWLREASGLRA